MARFVIGLTGTYCAGKNYAARLLEQRGLPVLDVDKLGHEIIEKKKMVILERFGIDLRKPDGTIDRKLLGERVFGKPDKLAALEAIVHPKVIEMMDEWVAAQGGKPCVINAALLHRTPVFHELKAVILVQAPAIIRFFRARKRDRLPWAALFKRFASQRNFNSQYSSQNTDIYNVGNWFFWGSSSRKEEKLKNRIDEILSLLGIR